ncbi:MAG: VWA domain-containing protein [Anaerolineales bacterium]|nr:VWA domain-containing protein [Anaerolineales bacterium]
MTKKEKLRIIIFTIFICIITFWGGWNSVHAETPPKNVCVIFLIDDSGSMGDNDRTDLRYTAARLFVSALGEGDAVAAIRFATSSSLILPECMQITDAQSKESILEALQPVSPDGYTNVLAAFRQTDQLLSQEQFGERKNVVILLTDGKPEIERPYPNYEEEAIQAATKLGIPVYSISLTPQGQTSFLSQLAQATDGKVIPAKTANDLLDSYLQILGELKDRTIMGTDSLDGDLTATISLDPGLTPYINHVTFIASQANLENVQLLDPDGQVVSKGDPGVAFYLDSDSRFIAISLENPPGGDWRFQFSNDQPIQVRAILHSRLRARVISPAGLHPGGEPIYITVGMIEEMPDGQIVKIIGEASFSAEIQQPDGTLQSLDQFYDDGTHGDQVSGDGIYTREYYDTTAPGTYHIHIRGIKGVVPVQAAAIVEVIPLPRFKVQVPVERVYGIRTTPISLLVALEGDFQPEWIEGNLQAWITAPSGDVDRAVLIYENGQFSGTFMPAENGAYSITFMPDGLYYRGIEVTETHRVHFSSRLIGTLVIQEIQVGVTDNQGVPRLEVPQGGEPIPVLVRITSHATQDVAVRIFIENLPGFTLDDLDSLVIPAGALIEQTLYLRNETSLQPGTWDGRLAFTTSDAVDLINPAVPLAFELFTPTLTVSSEEPVYPSACRGGSTLSMTFTIASTSLVDETLTLMLEGPRSGSQKTLQLSVPPGTSQFGYSTEVERKILPNKQEWTVLVVPDRPGVVISPEGKQTISLTVPGFWQTCRKPIIFLGLGLMAAVMILIRTTKRMLQRSQPALVNGTLIHWQAETPEMVSQVNLTAFKKTEVRIGRNIHCDIVIPDELVADEHLVIAAEAGNADEIRLIIRPISKVMKGYQKYTSSFPLEEKVTYQIGGCRFEFIADLQF